MNGYTKLFNSILASTIWRAPDHTRLVWITMLAMADRNGVVEASIPGLADFAHVSLADCEEALAALAAPDKYSRTKVQEGRRIEEVDGGWRLINHAKYRAKLNADERREYLKIKQREHRSQQPSTNVNNGSGESTLSTQAEAEAEAKEEEEKTELATSTARDPEMQQVIDNWKKNNPLRRKAHAKYRIR